MVEDTKDQEGTNIPKGEENWPKKLWILVERAKKGSHTIVSTPLEEINLDQNPFDFDKNSICGYVGCA